jgi:hypothetical protein
MCFPKIHGIRIKESSVSCKFCGVSTGVHLAEKLTISFVFSEHESLGGNQNKTSLAYPPTKSLFRISYLEIIRPKACKDVRLEPAFSVGAVAGIVRNKCALWKHNPGGLFRSAHSPMEPKPSRNVFQRHSDFPRDAQIGGSTADDSFKQLRTATETLGVFVLLVGDLG